MFRCIDCGAVFEKPAKSEEDRGERFGERCYEDMLCCPECKSTDIEEGEVCVCCGEFFGTGIHYGFCKNCTEKTYAPEKAFAYIEENQLESEFLKWLTDKMSFLFLKHQILTDNDDYTLYDLHAELKEFCLADWRAFAEFLDGEVTLSEAV